MRVYSAHDGAGLDVSQPLRTFSTVSALADVVSLVTGIVADSVILITEDGAQLTDDLLVQLVDAQMLASHSVSPVCQIEPDLFVFSRDILSAEPELVAPSLQNSLVLELPLNCMFCIIPRCAVLMDAHKFSDVEVSVLSDHQPCKSFALPLRTHCRI